jgi:hypothetical protein
MGKEQGWWSREAATYCQNAASATYRRCSSLEGVRIHQIGRALNDAGIGGENPRQHFVFRRSTG